jgi:hypothetical protein
MRSLLSKRGLMRLAAVAIVLEVGSWILLPAIPAAWLPGLPVPEAGFYQAYAPWSYLAAAAFVVVFGGLLWRFAQTRQRH